jgi:hypothetical protein
MRQFLIKVLFFNILLISLLVAAYGLADFILKQRKQQILKINEEITSVFAGDSHIECAVNDSLILNSINIAQSGEAYMYTYLKIKSLLEYNNHIRTIFIGYSLQDVLKSTEERWLFLDQFVVEQVSNYNYLMGKAEKTLIFKKNPKACLKGMVDSVLKSFSFFLRSYLSDDKNDKIMQFGGYECTVRNKLQDDIKINSFLGKKFETGLVQLKYLGMISELCHQKSIKLVLLNTPKNKYFKTKYDKETSHNWLAISNFFPNDSLLDYSEFTMPDSCFYDMEHLNYMGATKFSKYLDAELKLDK